MEDAVRILSDRGIVFTKGIYTTQFQLDKRGYETEGLLRFYNAAVKNNRFTINDTPIPTEILGKWRKKPRETVEVLQTCVKEIYVDGKIEKLREKSKLIKKGEHNIRAIMRGIVKQKIPIPEGYSVEGVGSALRQGLGAWSAFDCNSEEASLRRMRKDFRGVLKPEAVDKIVAMQLKDIAEKWEYKRL